jgi:Fe-S oxidoreductase
LDVRDLVAKVRKGRYGNAWRAYRDAVLFPGVVSALCAAPCRAVCVRAVVQGGGGAVDLKSIEQGVVAKAERRPPVRYAIPQKSERVAVVGAGLSGLACAWRLGSKGYRVTLHEASDRVGGSVRGLLPDETIDADIDGMFRVIDCDLRLGGRVADMGALMGENAAAYVATGAGGDDFGLLGGWDRRMLATAASGVFMGGALTSAVAAAVPNVGAGALAATPDVAAAVENGLRAASAIEEFLKTGRNEGVGPLFNRPRVNERFYALGYGFDAGGGAPGAEPPDACAAEAARCPGCNCSLCIDACELIRHYKQNPKRIAADLGVSVLPVDEKIRHVASRMLNSCNLCGLCTAVCPVGVDTCAAMHASRRILKENGHLPAAYHDFWMADMEFSQSDEARALVAPPDGRARLLFFPGCQLAASLPQAVARTFDFIRREEPAAAMLLSCCGVPADWAGEAAALGRVIDSVRADWERLGRPGLLYACSTCKKTFERHLPDARGALVYEWLAARRERLAAPAVARDPEARVRVYDPCASRDDAAGQAAVRMLARGAGFAVEEDAAAGGAHAACCGFGGQIYAVDSGLLEKIVRRRTAGAQPPYVAYCANCRDLFLSQGKESWHILEILFPPEPETESAPEPGAGAGFDAVSARRLPGLTGRRENRRLLKARYVGGVGAEAAGGVDAGRAKEGMATDEGFDLQIAPGIEAKMDRLLLLREDVEAAVAHCEREGAYMVDAANGRRVGSRRGRVVTVWVEYGVEPGTRRVQVYNVYSHRMKIVG